MKWELAKPWGIERNAPDTPGTSFHGGRVIDVLIANVALLLAAADSSGVWRVNRSTSDASPLSMLWENASVECLAHDGGDHVYAGCGNDYNTAPASEFLYETDRSQPFPHFADWLPVPLPTEIQAVHDIVVVAEQKRNVVLATDQGLYWSPVPPVGAPYTWQPTDGTSGRQFFSVCAGPNGQVIAGALNPNIAKDIWPLYIGYWDSSGSAMTVSRSELPDEVNWSSLGRTTVDSRAWTLGMFAYALSVRASQSGDPGGTPVCVMRSENGGTSWRLCGDTLHYWGGTGSITDSNLVGDDRSGGVIHRITASQGPADVVAFGIRQAFISSDRGDSWSTIGMAPTANPHLHDDVHVVAFDPNDKTGHSFVLASDGGLASTTDFGTTFVDHNECMTNFEMYSTVSGIFYGRFSVTATPNLAFAGLQDNGNIYTELSDPADHWHQIDEHTDGGGCFLIRSRDGSLVAARNGAGGSDDYHHLWHAKWDPASGSFPLGGTGVPLLGTDGTLVDDLEARLEPVSFPTFSDPEGRLMYAVGWTPEPTAARIYGLFADDDGSNPYWRVVAGWPPNINLRAAASVDGTEILAVAASSGGAFSYRITPAFGEVPPWGELGTITEFLPDVLPVDSTGGGLVHLIRAVGADTYYALFNRAKGGGAVLATYRSGEAWERLGSGPVGALPDAAFTGLAVVDAPPGHPGQRLFACTDRNVYVSEDSGDTWTDVSAGLPRSPHCAGLEARESSDRDSTEVYLSTWGWSLWHANMS